jgi:uncharacterized protein YecT (DUF1311 family)
MKRIFLPVLGICGFIAANLLAETAPAEEAEIVAVSPSRAFEIESVPPTSSAANDDATPDLWVVSKSDRTQRARLPKQSPDSPTDDELHFSPNEEWLFGLRHVGSGLQYGNIYHLLKPLRIEVVGPEGHFNEFVWEKGVKLGALKRNSSADGDYAMTFFGGWSVDSSRLLLNLCGGEKKGALRCGYFYFNTRAKDFETTDYSRKLSHAKSPVLTCAEPVDALPAEAELKTRFDSLDQQLNAKYTEVLAKAEKDRAAVVRRAQRDWLKQRDAGEKLYVSLFPAAEKPRRRLQFLADVTAARIETPPDQWE